MVADYSQNPYFSIGPTNIDIVLSGYPISIDNFFLSGIMEADGLHYQHGMVSGVIDARVLESVINFTADQLCNIFAGLGSDCQPCSDAQAYCFEIEAIGMNGASNGVPLECVGFSYCHPDCNNNSCSNPSQGICEY